MGAVAPEGELTIPPDPDRLAIPMTSTSLTAPRFLAPETVADPYDFYRELREHAPV